VIGDLDTFFPPSFFLVRISMIPRSPIPPPVLVQAPQKGLIRTFSFTLSHVVYPPVLRLPRINDVSPVRSISRSQEFYALNPLYWSSITHTCATPGTVVMYSMYTSSHLHLHLYLTSGRDLSPRSRSCCTRLDLSAAHLRCPLKRVLICMCSAKYTKCLGLSVVMNLTFLCALCGMNLP